MCGASASTSGGQSDSGGEGRPRRGSRALTERLVELMAEGEHSPVELAQRIDLPLTEVVAWASNPDHVRIVAP